MLKPPRYLRFTKLGAYTVLLTIGIGFGAMNTGNNLVYMIFGMMLGFITASGVISEMSLRHLDTDWIFPQETFAQKHSVIRLIIRNLKKKIPSFAIRVETVIESEKFKIKRAVQSYFLFLPAQSQKFFDIHFRPEKRGAYRIKEIKIETQFPFGFFRKYLIRPVEKEFVVYPEIDAAKIFLVNRHKSESSQSLPLKGRGETFWGIRHFSEGDSPRHISWKISAKQSRLMVRETEREREKKLIVTMEPVEKWSALGDEELESAISFAASLIRAKFSEGYAVGFVSRNLLFAPSIARKNMSNMFKHLALFDPKEEARRGGAPELGDAIKKGGMEGREVEIIDILALWKMKS